jgi:hypothetical protein
VDYEQEETTSVSRFSAPKGQKDSAQGFNLGFNPGLLRTAPRRAGLGVLSGRITFERLTKG